MKKQYLIITIKPTNIIETYHWLSFCDSGLPKERQFLGVCIVMAKDSINAVQLAHELGINPGGEVEIYPVDNATAKGNLNKLFNRDELIERKLIT